MRDMADALCLAAGARTGLAMSARLPRVWPAFFGPGWIALYIVGTLLWVAIFELGGVVVVVGILVVGVILLFLGDWWMNVGAKRVRLPKARVVGEGRSVGRKVL